MSDWLPGPAAVATGYGRRQLFLAHVDHLSAWRSVVGERVVNAIFLATERVPDKEDVASLAGHLIEGGVFYVSCWGAGCDLVHDLFDEEEVWLDVQSDQESDSFVMTTWHDDESLEDALAFFWNAAEPGDGKEWGPTYLALSIGSAALQEALVRAAAAL